MCHAEWPGREMTASGKPTSPWQTAAREGARTSQAAAGSRLPAVPGRASARGCAQPGARPSSGGGAGLPGLAPAAAGAASSSPPASPTYLSARTGGGHGSAGMGATWTGRSSAFPLLTGSGFRHDAGGTNGLHYPRGPAIVRRHQAATAVLRAGGLPSLAPPSSRLLPASGVPSSVARARKSPLLRTPIEVRSPSSGPPSGACAESLAR